MGAGADAGGLPAVVADNGSADGSADVARAAGALVVRSRSVGTAPRAMPPSWPPPATSCASWTPTRPSTRRSCPPWPGRCSRATADLVVGRRTTRSLRAWPPPARLANLALARTLRRRTGLPCATSAPMRAFRREDLLGLGLERPALRLPAADAARRTCRRLAGGGGPGDLPPQGRPVEGDRDGAGLPARRARHARGARRMRSAPGPGRRAGEESGGRSGQDPAAPRRTRRTRPQSSRRPHSPTRLPLRPPRRCSTAGLVLDGVPGDWPAGRTGRVRPQAGGSLDGGSRPR